MKSKIDLIFIFLVFFCCCETSRSEETQSETVKGDLNLAVFVVLSQNHPRHATIGNQTKGHLLKNLKEAGVKRRKVLTLHTDLTIQGGWTLTPLMPELIKVTHPSTEWYFFLDEAAVVNVTILQSIIGKLDPFRYFFIGHALHDAKPNILHHWYETVISYPDLSAGFFMSRPLVSFIAKEMAKGPFHLEGMPVDHSIDVAFELAKTIFHLPSKTGKIEMFHDKRFCTEKKEGCAIYPRDTTCKVSKDSSIDMIKETLFAVKTCKDFHKKRLPIVLSTWASAAKNVIYVSEIEDPEFNTSILPGAEINTELGHCNKTEAILKYFVKHGRSNGWRWLVIADDDTILSVSKMMDAIQCYDKKGDEKIALGEKYGFRINGPGKQVGCDFLVGGSSMVFNLNVAELMMSDSHKLCTCEHPGYPDDIHLGECLYRLNITVVHHKEFHQVRPSDYNQNWLPRQGALSFHKHDDVDPMEVYNTWFKDHDAHLKQNLDPIPHSEL